MKEKKKQREKNICSCNSNPRPLLMLGHRKSSQRAKILPGITSPICFINGLLRGVGEILPGVPPYGLGGWAWLTVSEARSICGSRGGKQPQWGAPRQNCWGASGRWKRRRQGQGGRVAHRYHAILSRECHMPPNYCCASGEDKEETVRQIDS